MAIAKSIVAKGRFSFYFGECHISLPLNSNSQNIYVSGFDVAETLTTRGCVAGLATLRFADGQKRGLASRLVHPGCIINCPLKTGTFI